MLKLVRQVYEEEGTDLTLKTGAGLIGDLAETFPTGQLKELLLNDWVVAMLKTKTRNADLKKTLRWAREVSLRCGCSFGCSPLFDSSSSVQLCKRTAIYSTAIHNDSLFLDCPSTVLGSILAVCAYSAIAFCRPQLILRMTLQGPRPLHSTPTGAQMLQFPSTTSQQHNSTYHLVQSL